MRARLLEVAEVACLALEGNLVRGAVDRCGVEVGGDEGQGLTVAWERMEVK